MRRMVLHAVLWSAAASLRLCGADAKKDLGQAQRGLEIFSQCVACHRERATDVPNPGPDLRGVFGRPAGSVLGFRYSRALRNARRSWTEHALDAPGNTMPCPGIADAAERSDLIAYLKTLR